MKKKKQLDNKYSSRMQPRIGTQHKPLGSLLDPSAQVRCQLQEENYLMNWLFLFSFIPLEFLVMIYLFTFV